MTTRSSLLIAGLVTAGVCIPASVATAAEPLELTQRVALPDVRGRIDHMAIDVEGQRLFVAALGNDTVEVIDLKAGKRIQELKAREPQGVAYLADTRRLFVANGQGARVDVFSGPQLGSAGRIDDLADADNLRYDVANGKLYLGYGSALATIDPAGAVVEQRVKLAAHPESFQLETKGPRIFVNVPGAQQIAVVDRVTHTQVATWAVEEARANYPMALDEPGRRVFVATRRPARLLVYDTTTGKRVADLPLGGDADDLFFDPERRQVYAICGEGVIDVVRQLDADRYERIAQLPTAAGARTGLFSAELNRLYVAVPARGSSPAEIRVYHAR